MASRVVLALVLLLSAAGVTRADSAREARARTLYDEGRKAYEVSDFQKAYDAFKESYLLSHEPALLYNIASALQGLKRPHEAAEALRSFLRLQPTDPDRPEIEKRILTLEEEQRLLDAERKPTPPVEVHTPPPAIVQPVIVTTAPERTSRRKVVIAVVVSVGAVVLAGTAIGLAIGLTSSNTEPYSPANIGPIPGTR
jgi:tetratricopeptide (TPR) repeat protein